MSLVIAVLKTGYFKVIGKKIVLYNKFHPIYSDYFTNERQAEVRWVYFDNGWIRRMLGRFMMKWADVYHVDASGFHNAYLEQGKRVVVECEGVAREEYLLDKRVHAVLFESEYAGRRQLHLPKCSLAYPAVKQQKEFSKGGDKFSLLAVGFGSFKKGFDVSYEVYKRLREEGYNVRLQIAGTHGHDFGVYPEVDMAAYEAADFESMFSEMAGDPDVEMSSMGRFEILDRIYPATDLLLFFSRMETFGFSILEAMSFGIPVVSVRFKAIPEMVEHGKNGYLCNPFQWDGVSEIDELRMNYPEWKRSCVEEGVSYVKAIIDNPVQFQAMRLEAKKTIDKFSYARRSSLLMRCYGWGNGNWN